LCLLLIERKHNQTYVKIDYLAQLKTVIIDSKWWSQLHLSRRNKQFLRFGNRR